MTNIGQKNTVISLVLGAASMTLASSAAYTLFVYGWSLFFPYFIIVMGFTSFLVTFLFLPMIAILLRVGNAGLIATSATTFIVFLFLFFVWNVISLGEALSFVQSGEVLVIDGELTSNGYIYAIKDSLASALFAALGAIVFWGVSLRVRDVRV